MSTRTKEKEGNQDKKTFDFDRRLLELLPDFDPGWSDDIKLKWFGVFDELLKRNGEKISKKESG